MQFEQHGHFQLWTKNNVLCARLHGTWNQVAAENYATEFKKVAKQLARPWAHLVYMNDWELCSPDVFPVIKELVDWCIENELTRVANVYTYSYIKEGFVNKMVTEQQGSFQRVVFDNEFEAVEWLNYEGFEVIAQEDHA